MSTYITYGDIFRMFKQSINIKDTMIDDYRPAKYPYIAILNDKQVEVPGIVLFLSDGSRMLYYPDASKVSCNDSENNNHVSLCK